MKNILLCFSFFSTLIDAQPAFVWAQSHDAVPTGEFYSFAMDNYHTIATDNSGNTYEAGSFSSSSIIFGSTVLFNNSTGSDIFLTKYDSNGNVIWAKRAGGKNADMAQSIACDPFGNIYIVGTSGSDSISFDNIVLVKPSVGTDMFIAKYDVNGIALWAKCSSGNGYTWGESIATDANGNCYATGYFFCPIVVFDSDTLTNHVAYSRDIFIVKYDSNGNLLWAKNPGGNGDDDPASIKSDNVGNVFVTGHFRGTTVDLDSITLFNASTSSSQPRDVFLAKYDSNGNILWAKSAGGLKDDDARGMTIDLSGNAYITGYFCDSLISFDSVTLTNDYAVSMFLVKYDGNGQVLWAKKTGDSAVGQCITLDFNGEIFAAGYTFITDEPDIYIVKYDASGNFLWSKSAKGKRWDEIHSIATDNIGNIYVAGGYVSPTLFLDTILLQNDPIPSSMKTFIAKFSTSILVSFSENCLLQQTTVFPNPANGKFSIRLPENINFSEIKITNLYGEEILPVQIGPAKCISFDISDKPKGIYFAEIISGNKKEVRKIIVE